MTPSSPPPSEEKVATRRADTLRPPTWTSMSCGPSGGATSGGPSGPATASWRFPKWSHHTTSARRRERGAEGHGVPAEGQGGGGRSEDVAPVEGGGHFGRLGEGDGVCGTPVLCDRGQQETVVGADEPPATPRADGDPAPVTTDTGVDDSEDDPWAKVRQRSSERLGATADVERRDPVRQVDDTEGRPDPAQHRMDDAHELVSEAVVGEEEDRGRAWARPRTGRSWSRAPGGLAVGR